MSTSQTTIPAFSSDLRHLNAVRLAIARSGENAPPPGAAPTIGGFVTYYIRTFTGEVDRQPTPFR